MVPQFAQYSWCSLAFLPSPPAIFREENVSLILAQRVYPIGKHMNALPSLENCSSLQSPQAPGTLFRFSPNHAVSLFNFCKRLDNGKLLIKRRVTGNSHARFLRGAKSRQAPILPGPSGGLCPPTLCRLLPARAMLTVRTTLIGTHTPLDPGNVSYLQARTYGESLAGFALRISHGRGNRYFASWRPDAIGLA